MTKLFRYLFDRTIQEEEQSMKEQFLIHPQAISYQGLSVIKTTKYFLVTLLLFTLGLPNVYAVYSATSSDPSQIGYMFCQRPYPNSNTMDVFYPFLTLDNSAKDQVSNNPPECNCRMGIVNRFYQYADNSTLTTATLAELSISTGNGRITSIKTQWDTLNDALIGISVGTSRPAHRVVGVINTSAQTTTWNDPDYVTTLSISTFFDPSISEIPLVCYIKISFSREPDYIKDYCGTRAKNYTSNASFDLGTDSQYDQFLSFYGQIVNGFIVGLGVEFSSTRNCNLNAPDATNITATSQPWAYDFPRGSSVKTCGYDKQHVQTATQATFTQYFYQSTYVPAATIILLDGVWRGIGSTIQSNDVLPYSIQTISPFSFMDFSVDQVAQKITFSMTGFPAGREDYWFQYKLVTKQESNILTDQMFFASCDLGNCTFSFKCEVCDLQTLYTKIYEIGSTTTSPQLTIDLTTTDCATPDMIVYNITANTTTLPSFLRLTQATSTTNAVLSWASATNADFGTYYITLGATAGTGSYSYQSFSGGFNLYVAATGQCFITAVPIPNISYRINSTDVSTMRQPAFIPTCQNYQSIIYTHTCTPQPGKDCAFFQKSSRSIYSWSTTNISQVGVYALIITGYFNDDNSYRASQNLTLTVSDSCITIVVPTIDNQFYYPLNDSGAPTNFIIPSFTLASTEPGCLFTTFIYSFSCSPPTNGDCSLIFFDPQSLNLDWSQVPSTVLGQYILSVSAVLDGTSLITQNDFSLTVDVISEPLACQVDSFLPSGTNMTINYILNSGPITYELPLFNQSPDCGYQIQSIIANQMSGQILPSGSIRINETSLTLLLDDLEFQNQTVQLNIVVTLNSSNFDSNNDLILSITFTKQFIPNTQKYNSAPSFEQTPAKPEKIPCLGLKESVEWRYAFPIARDDEGNDFTTEFSCPALLAVFTVIDTVTPLNLVLKSSTQYQPISGLYSCEVVLKDSLGKNTTYIVEFQVECNQTSLQVKQVSSDSQNELTAQVTKISTQGDITVTFNQQLLNPEVFNQSRHLVQGTFYDKLTQSIKLEVTPGTSYQDADKLNFTYHVTSVKNNTMTIKMNFLEPVYVSSTIKPDQVKITFNDTSMFVSTSGVVMKQTQIEPYKIPKQTTQNQLNFNAQQAIMASFTVLAVSFTLSFLLQAVLNRLLSSIRSLGLIVHMFLLSLSYPLNCLSFFGQIFNLISFNLLPTAYIFEKVFQFSEVQDSYLSDWFSWVGYNSMLSVTNMATLFVFMVLAPLGILTLAVVNKIFPFWRLLPDKHEIWIQKYVDKTIKSAFWNSTISFLNENYLVLSVCCLIQIQQLQLDPRTDYWSAIFCSCIGLAGCVLTALFPLLIFILYSQMLKSTAVLPSLSLVEQDKKIAIDEKGDFNTIQAEQKRQFTEEQCVEFITRYGVLLKGLDVSKMGKWISVLVPTISLSRRLLMALSVTLLYAKPVFCIFAFNFITLFYIIFFAWHMPNQSLIENFLQLLNEITVMFVNYHLFCFTRFVVIDTQVYVANSVVMLVIGNILINILVIFWSVGTQLIRQAKYKYIMWKHKKQVTNKKQPLRFESKVSHVQSDYFTVQSTIQSMTKPSPKPFIVPSQSVLQVAHPSSLQEGQIDASLDFRLQTSIQQTGAIILNSEDQLPQLKRRMKKPQIVEQPLKWYENPSVKF